MKKKSQTNPTRKELKKRARERLKLLDEINNPNTTIPMLKLKILFGIKE